MKRVILTTGVALSLMMLVTGGLLSQAAGPLPTETYIESRDVPDPDPRAAWPVPDMEDGLAVADLIRREILTQQAADPDPLLEEGESGCRIMLSTITGVVFPSCVPMDQFINVVAAEQSAIATAWAIDTTTFRNDWLSYNVEAVPYGGTGAVVGNFHYLNAGNTHPTWVPTIGQATITDGLITGFTWQAQGGPTAVSAFDPAVHASYANGPSYGYAGSGPTASGYVGAIIVPQAAGHYFHVVTDDGQFGMIGLVENI